MSRMRLPGGLRNLLVALMALVAAPVAGLAADRSFTDDAGRSVAVPETVTRVMPAGPPADVLLLSIAPDLLVGLVEPFSADARKLVPASMGALPQVPRMTGDPGRADIAAVKAASPGLLVDYGDIAPRYVGIAERVEAATGIAYAIFDGRLAQTPRAVRAVAHLLGRQARGEAVARSAEEILASLRPLAALPPDQRVSVYYGRGKDGLLAIRPGTTLDEAIAFAGGRNVAPAGKGAFVKLTAEEVARLAPKAVIVADPAAIGPASALRAALPASTLFLADRGAPFHWMEAPPSLNRLVGALWLASKLHPDRTGFDAARARQVIGALFGLDLSEAEVAAMLR